VKLRLDTSQSSVEGFRTLALDPFFNAGVIGPLPLLRATVHATCEPAPYRPMPATRASGAGRCLHVPVALRVELRTDVVRFASNTLDLAGASRFAHERMLVRLSSGTLP